MQVKYKVTLIDTSLKKTYKGNTLFAIPVKELSLKVQIN